MKITRFVLRSLLALCPLLLVLPPAALAEVTVEIRLLLPPGDPVVRPLPRPLSPRAQYAVNRVPALDGVGNIDPTGASRRSSPQDIGMPAALGSLAVAGQGVEHVSRVSLRIDTDAVARQTSGHSMPLVVVLDIPEHVGAEISIRCARPVPKGSGPLLKARAVPCITEQEQPSAVFGITPFDGAVVGR